MKETAHAQIIQLGAKAGLNYSWVRHDEAEFRDIVKTSPILGFNVGAVVTFKVKERYFFHSEYIFSTKGRKASGLIDKELRDKTTYNFIEIPLLYNVFFKGHLKGGREFKWYAGAGPLFSYWLGGKGTVYNSEFSENEYPAQDYKIIFGKRSEDFAEVDKVYIEDAKRFQLGVNAGIGLMLEPNERQRIMIDLRFEYGHTWIGKAESTDYIIPVSYEDNLKARNMGIRFSAMYLFEFNLSKKSRHKGKTTIKGRLKRQ